MRTEAEEQLKAAVDDYRASTGEEHRNIAAASAALGLTYYLWGRHDEAEHWLGRAIELQERLLGPDHTETMNSKYNP